MKNRLTLTALFLIAAACSRDEVQQRTTSVTEKVDSAVERVSVPEGRPDDPAAREKERFELNWRRLAGFQGPAQQAAQRQRQQVANIRFVTGVKESMKDITPQAINSAPVAIPITGDVSGPSVLRTQVYLDRAAFSVGAIDGRWGKNSAIAVWWFQRTRGLNATGDVDEQTYRALASEAGGVPAIITHQLTDEDVKGPFVDVPDEMYDKAKLDCLCYESIAEKLSERFHMTTDLLALLNPGVELGSLRAGQSINVLNVRPPMNADRPDIARIVVSLQGNTFNAFDAAGNVLFHAPTTVGNEYDPSPTETLEIVKVAHDPHFHYQPTLFAEVPDDEPEANLNPGPNSPVGVVWIALSKKHFGIHGTSDPDSIGYASSHGCIRLTNWDAKEVAHRVQKGVKVDFTDTRGTPKQAAAE